MHGKCSAIELYIQPHEFSFEDVLTGAGEGSVVSAVDQARQGRD